MLPGVPSLWFAAEIFAGRSNRLKGLSEHASAFCQGALLSRKFNFVEHGEHGTHQRAENDSGVGIRLVLDLPTYPKDFAQFLLGGVDAGEVLSQNLGRGLGDLPEDCRTFRNRFLIEVFQGSLKRMPQSQPGRFAWGACFDGFDEASSVDFKSQKENLDLGCKVPKKRSFRYSGFTSDVFHGGGVIAARNEKVLRDLAYSLARGLSRDFSEGAF